MNKTIIVSLIALFILAVGCEENKSDWPVSALTETPVYSIYDIQWDGGGTEPFSLEVYQEQELMISYKTEMKKVLKPFETSDFVDNSTDSIYDFSYTVHMVVEKTTEDADSSYTADSTYTELYAVEGYRSTGTGTLAISGQLSPSDTTIITTYQEVMLDELMVLTDKN